MEVINTEIEGVKIIKPDYYRDARGYFCETYNEKRYNDAGITAKFVQDNESCSSKGVVRGLHWQAGAYAQAKLVRVLKGSVIDIAVDIRKDSPTFGKHISVKLTAEKGEQFFIPRGFAHGFIVLEDNTVFSYKCDNLYNKEMERGMLLTDPDLGIDLPDLGCEYLFSEKDKIHPGFSEIEPYVEK